MVPIVPVDPESKRGIRPPVVLRARLHYGAPLFGYVLSLALVSVTGVFRLALLGQSDFFYPLVFFQPAIALASFLGGAGPGMAAILLSAVFGSLFFPYRLAPSNWIGFAIVGPLLATGFAHLRYVRERNRTVARELASFKMVGDNLSDWIVILSESGHIRYVNLKASTDLGWTDSELAGRHIEALIPEAQRPILSAGLGAASTGTAKPIELSFERRDRSTTLTELVCTVVGTGNERVICAVAREIGERKQIEKKLQEIRHWESLGVLAGGLAHDFNNLLTSILGNASLAKDIVASDHETAALLDGIISASESSSDLVRLMLATSGYRSRSREQLQLDRLLDWTLANRRLPSNVTVVREVAEAGNEGGFLIGDRPSIETLFWSLIANAAEAYGQQDGEIRVAIRSGPAPALQRADFEEGDPGSGECLGIVVEDRGSGMSPEILKRAFDPFFSTRFTGRGLGLPAVRGIVRAYSGKLLVETAVGQGTRVEVWLPLHVTEPRP